MIQTRQCKRCGMAERRNIEIVDYEPYLSQKTQDRLRELAVKAKEAKRLMERER